MTDQAVTVTVPFAIRKRGGRKLVIMPEGASCKLSQTRIDNTIVKTLARAHRWKRLLEGGEHTSAAELAQVEKINQSYVCRVLRLTLLAPDIIDQILDGKQPHALQVESLLEPFPVDWEQQRLKFNVN
jgi:hypothetical protein